MNEWVVCVIGESGTGKERGEKWADVGNGKDVHIRRMDGTPWGMLSRNCCRISRTPKLGTTRVGWEDEKRDKGPMFAVNNYFRH